MIQYICNYKTGQCKDECIYGCRHAEVPKIHETTTLKLITTKDTNSNEFQRSFQMGKLTKEINSSKLNHESQNQHMNNITLETKLSGRAEDKLLSVEPNN